MRYLIALFVAFICAIPCAAQTGFAWNLAPMIGLSQPAAADAPDTPAFNPTSTLTQEVRQNVKDIHFDFAKSDLRPEDRSVLESDAQWLKANPQVFVTIEGDADERGGVVYNLALTENRALTAKDALVVMGVPADQIIYSEGWGKLYPVCGEADESCWQQNRRAHFAAW